jgi:hypothetical protein
MFVFACLILAEYFDRLAKRGDRNWKRRVGICKAITERGVEGARKVSI